MASINTIVKRKQYLWLGIVVVGTASAIGGALYLSDVDMSGNGETVAEQEPVAKENRARIDDVVDFLKNASDSEQYVESPTIRSRLDEMIVLLDQYTANGTCGTGYLPDYLLCCLLDSGASG